jgi:hypothetical protein
MTNRGLLARTYFALGTLAFGVGFGAATPAFAQSGSAAIDNPPPPAAPAVVARDADGHVTVRATRIAEGIVLDGRLDERLYQDVQSIGDVLQQEPAEGQPVTYTLTPRIALGVLVQYVCRHTRNLWAGAPPCHFGLAASCSPNRAARRMFCRP